ncbi:hypothetical protein ILUMI_19273, partial [Ignelater luminosus]
MLRKKEYMKDRLTEAQLEAIMSNIDLDNSDDGYDFYDDDSLVAPDYIWTRYSIPLEKSLSVDVEQICSKTRHFMEQYMPNKPHKWGFKLFVLGRVSGFFYTFELHAGQENDPSKRLQNEPDLGAYSNV